MCSRLLAGISTVCSMVMAPVYAGIGGGARMKKEEGKMKNEE
jgi:hypothetical protein